MRQNVDNFLYSNLLGRTSKKNTLQHQKQRTQKKSNILSRFTTSHPSAIKIDTTLDLFTKEFNSTFHRAQASVTPMAQPLRDLHGTSLICMPHNCTHTVTDQHCSHGRFCARMSGLRLKLARSLYMNQKTMSINLALEGPSLTLLMVGKELAKPTKACSFFFQLRSHRKLLLPGCWNNIVNCQLFSTLAASPVQQDIMLV